MAKLKLNLTYEKPSLLNVPVTRNIKRCVEATLDAEGILERIKLILRPLRAS